MDGQEVRRLFINRGGGGGLDPGAELSQVAGLEGETSGSPWGFPPYPQRQKIKARPEPIVGRYERGNVD